MSEQDAAQGSTSSSGAALAIAPGRTLLGWQAFALALAVALAPAAVGTFNRLIDFALFYAMNWKYLSILWPIS